MTNEFSTKRHIAKPTLAKKFQTFLGKNKLSARVAAQDEFDESSLPSRPIVRLLTVLLVLHIIVIGGIWLRGSLEKQNLPIATEKTPELAIAPEESMTKTVMDSAPTHAVSTEKTPLPEMMPSQGNAVLQPSDMNIAAQTAAGSLPAVTEGEDLLVEEPSQGGIIKTPQAQSKNPNIANVAKGATRHLVASGDSWERIAKEYGRDVDALKKANANVQFRNGIYLVIPDPNGNVPKSEASQRDTGDVHVLAKGETLTKIAKQYKTTVAKLMEVNKFTEKDTRRLKIGQSIKLP